METDLLILKSIQLLLLSNIMLFSPKLRDKETDKQIMNDIEKQMALLDERITNMKENSC